MPDSLPRISQRDVFICFSKARPGEAQVAIALKDQLEQRGFFAFEYEDWKWVAAGVQDDEPDVDRETLRRMLTTCSVVVLISPHNGAASAGVQAELAELRSLSSPVILLHWSPSGWHPRLEAPELAGLNIIWSVEGRTSGEAGVAQNQCEHLARLLAVAAATACHVRWAMTDHPSTAGRLLAMIPEEPRAPLVNLRLTSPALELAEWPDAPDIDAVAASIAVDAPDRDLRAFVHDWRAGIDLIAANLAGDARESLKAPVKLLSRGLETLCRRACEREPASQTLTGDALRRRGLMLVRLNRVDDAVPVLQEALLAATDDTRCEILQALALAQQDSDPAGSIESFTRAIECSTNPEIACALAYSRGVIRGKTAASRAAAIDDFTFVIERGTIATARHSALFARARLRADDDRDGAIADHTQILADADATPRTAVTAWIERGALYYAQGRARDAIGDWTRAIDAADAEPVQRFRALEARAQAFEHLGERGAAADDYEAMTRFGSVSARYRDELTRTIASLRGPHQ